MMRHRQMVKLLAAYALLLAIAVAGCANGPAVSGSFDRSFPVSGHTRLEINSASGDVLVTASADGNVHVRGEVRVSGLSQQEAQKQLAAITANPPVEQTPDAVRIGKASVRPRNTSITYTIAVPADTELSSNVASGAQTIRGLRGPVKATSASGSVVAENIAGDAQLGSLSGSVSATNMGDAVRASSASGSITISGAKDDVRASTQTGNINISKVGGRIEADSTSGSIDAQNVTGDAKLRVVSGGIVVHGKPASTSFWDLRTVSGSVEVGIATGANFHLLAEAMTGDVNVGIPIMIEEQGKHSLRAQIGGGGGRVEIHTVSGSIRLLPSN